MPLEPSHTVYLKAFTANASAVQMPINLAFINFLVHTESILWGIQDLDSACCPCFSVDAYICIRLSLVTSL